MSDSITIVECTRSGFVRHAVPGHVESGMTLGEALRRAGLAIDPPPDVGVFGERRELGDPVAPGDRIEIYRPLEIEPMEARRLRAVLRKRRS